jgi:hypothetical protein
MNSHTDGRSEGGAMVPLSPLQRKRLVILAREAWRKQTTDHGLRTTDYGLQTDDVPFEVPGEGQEVGDFDTWRHRQCLLAVERPGLSVCRNEDYLPLKAHFLMILGRVDEAEAAGERAAMDPRNRVLHEFRRACNEAAGVLDNPVQYAEGFLRRVARCGIDDAPDNAIWRAVYLLRRKARLERRKLGRVDSEQSEGGQRYDEGNGDQAADGAEVEEAHVGVGAAGLGDRERG